MVKLNNQRKCISEIQFVFQPESFCSLRPAIEMVRRFQTMKILIAEDDPVSRRLLDATVKKWGHETTTVENGEQAWEILKNSYNEYSIAILDWMMPELDGVGVCKRVRAKKAASPMHIIMLTAKSRKDDIVIGLEAGADDYVTKPFDRGELHARLEVGIRIITLQKELAERVNELEEILVKVRTLQGLLPICAYCKKIRDDNNYWQGVDHYLSEHSDARFSPSLCPDCAINDTKNIKDKADLWS